MSRPGNEDPVAGDRLGLISSRLPPSGRRRGTKPPLAPTGTITAFFTRWALIQAEHLGGSSLGGPTSASRREPPAAAAQVHAPTRGE